MDFRIADTFTASLARLTGGGQKAAKTTAFDLQMNPANPGLSFHKLDRAKDKDFWSVRVSSDIRLIVHKTASSLLLCFVGHHDDSYRWAERRKIERHPQTGAMQIVEIRELVREVEIQRYVDASQEPTPAAPTSASLEGVSEQQLLEYGVPPEWVSDVLAADEDGLLSLTDHLPAEAAEAVLSLATGTIPPVPTAAGAEDDPFEHPDAERRFRVMSDVDELKRALQYPWDRWAVFLHPAQRSTVERDYSGPARLSGSAGTGKTIVALHRAAHLVESDPDAKVLLATFSIPLARNLRAKASKLVGHEEDAWSRLSVRSLDEFAIELYEAEFGRPQLPTEAMLRSLIREALAKRPQTLSPAFVEAEWLDVVDAWQLDTWEDYRDVQWLGRKTRLGEKQRESLWGVYEQVRKVLHERGAQTMPMLYRALAERFTRGSGAPVDHVILDESQDVSVAQLRFLASLAADRPNGLFFAGDLGQRIFQVPFSWASLGVDVRGRSQTLRINYRTSHQIRRQADRLLHPEVSDVDGNTESRIGTVSAFNGPEPEILLCDEEHDECRRVASCIDGWLRSGFAPSEIAIFVRSEAQIQRALAVLKLTGAEGMILDGSEPSDAEGVAVSTMHRAKGLEFRAVAVMCCDDEVVPLQERIAAVADKSGLEEVYSTERHLLYVACTRARDVLVISAVQPESEFLDDLVAR